MTSLGVLRSTHAGGTLASNARRGVVLLLHAATLALVVACSDSAGTGPSGSSSDARADAGAPDRASAAGAVSPSDVSPENALEFARQPTRVDWQGGDADQGRALFALHCATCHGGDGKGEGPAAIALNPKPRDLTEGTFYIDANDNNETGEPSDLARVILVGAGAFGGSEAMQGWSETLSVDEVRHLVTFVESLAQHRE
jgi:mono/diheme cytochrome c family protein